MLNETDLKKVEEKVQEFFQKIGIEKEIKIGPFQESTIPIDLEVEDPGIFIGERGQVLTEIQYLLKLILRRHIDKPFYIDVDINNYKKKRIEYLKNVVQEAADEVVSDKKEKKLLPMSAYERRICHLELAKRTDVTTESIDQDQERRVVIKPSS